MTPLQRLHPLHISHHYWIQVSKRHRDRNVEHTHCYNHTLCVLDPCLIHYCPKGHECVVTGNGEATCICQRSCGERRKLVCGSDGHIYPNHCELHRAACLTEQSITIERGVHCIKHGKCIYAYIQVRDCII